MSIRGLARIRNVHRTLFAWNSGTPHPTASARDLLQTCLVELGISDERVDDALVMVTELVSNATRHAKGPYELRVRRTPTELIVEVHDRTCQIPEPRPLSSAEDLFAPRAQCRGGGTEALLAQLSESGRGLSIVTTLAAGCAGGRRTPTGKSMWFAVPVAPCSNGRDDAESAAGG
jgi:anti-sigma regulatory factor (Ser/Thr protein kinase)